MALKLPALGGSFIHDEKTCRNDEVVI